jgi:hypothetical protein
MDGIHTGNTHPKADFLGIHTADFLVGLGRTGHLLVQKILEIDAALFETCRVYVGYVVAQHVHTNLVVLQAGDAGVQ